MKTYHLTFYSLRRALLLAISFAVIVLAISFSALFISAWLTFSLLIISFLTVRFFDTINKLSTLRGDVVLNKNLISFTWYKSYFFAAPKPRTIHFDDIMSYAHESA